MRDSPAVVGGSSAAGTDAGPDVIELIPVIRRVVAARVRDFQLVDDLVQETLARVMAARDRIEQDTLAPYAVAIARNLVAAAGKGEDRAKRTAHLLIDEATNPPADGEVLQREENTVVGAALAGCPLRNGRCCSHTRSTGPAPPNWPPGEGQRPVRSPRN